MYFRMLRVCFLLLLGSSLCTAMCDLPLSLWCSSGETAKSCGVHEQCRQAMRKAPDAPPETKDGDKWKFECQHGDQECIGNLIETCAINILKDIKVYFPFINCIEGKSGMPEKDAEECASQQQIDLNPIITCANGPMGNALEHQMALQTDALNPPHKYVPWVTLNGVHTEKLERKAEEDLLNLICDTYKGPTPQKCLQRFSKSKRCYQD
ncbi:GILT-like protein [Mya arenaria]|uniref:GILT-like protein n=1 Tax=Mya arenaria TaxID=6604 RepID=A0ABY7F9X2_MYAAR|nr:GILT-like protein [Mya arenaria]